MKYMSYNNKSDIWSLGCLIYELCALKPPFTASSQKELAAKICSGYFLRLPSKYSDDLNTIIGAMIQVDVREDILFIFILYYFYIQTMFGSYM